MIQDILFVSTIEYSKQKKLGRVIFNSILTIFKQEKMKKFQVHCYDILTFGMDSIRFEIKSILSKLVCTIILYIFYFKFIRKVDTKVFPLVNFPTNSQFILLLLKKMH